MAAKLGSLPRKFFVAVFVFVGCLALLLLGSRMVSAESMVATWYGPGFEGATTANGETFDPSGYTAASKTLDFDTKLIVTYEGRSVVVRVNDRGPYVAGRDLDLAQGAAEYIGLTSVGVDTVDVTVADPSTPEGPYSPRSTPNQNAPGAGDSGSDTGPEAGAPAADDPDRAGRQERLRSEFGALDAGGSRDQYAEEDQYAAEDQYADVQPRVAEEIAPPPPPPAPKPAVPVPAPAPEPEALEIPPPDLAVENSTIERRVELELAAPPAPQPEPVAQPEPEESVEEPAPEVQEVAAPELEEKANVAPKKSENKENDDTGNEEFGGLTMLPDTGGASIALPVAGMLLIALGLSVLRLRR